MQTNTQVEFNVWKFNMPTVIGVLTIIGMLIAQTNNRTQIDTETKLRLDAIDSSRVAGKIQYDARLGAIEATLAKFSNVEFRVQATENHVDATDARLDRQSDALGALSKGIADVSSDLKLLTQRLEIAVPLKKSELIPFMDTPRELK